MNILIDKLHSEIPNWKNIISSIEKEDSSGSRSLREGEREVFHELKEFWKYNDFNPNQAKDLINEIKKHEPYHAPKWDEMGEFRRICVQYYTKDQVLFTEFRNRLKNNADSDKFSGPSKVVKDLSTTQKIKGHIGSITIGEWEWMDRNLDVDFLRNGDLIHNAKNADEWRKAGAQGIPAWCYYDFNSNNEQLFGKLYNWYAIIDRRNIAPKGWEVSCSVDKILSPLFLPPSCC